MGFWRSLGGMLQIELKCADPSYALSQLQERSITVYQVRFIDDFSVSFLISRQQLKQLKILSDKRGFDYRLQAKEGLYWLLPRLLHRPVLLVGLAILLAIGIYLPTRVLFIQIEGNASIPTRQILEASGQCGIEFGASRAEVRSEKMKNALLQSLPQLQWAGINTSGCVAVISVRERQLTEEKPEAGGVASIVATRDGVITTVTATKGNALCKIGQAVKAGQTLISGYTDCGLSIQAVRAEGEIYAKTERDLTIIAPCGYEQRDESADAEKKYALIIGKKRINLYFGSGILDGSCVKMYEENYVTLPGGFQLPVALVTEVWFDSELETAQAESADASWLYDTAQRYLIGDMIAGQILSSDEALSQEDGIVTLSGHYACLEMIGKLREEEIVKPNGTND